MTIRRLTLGHIRMLDRRYQGCFGVRRRTARDFYALASIAFSESSVVTSLGK